MRRGGLPPFHRPSRPSGHQASQGCTALGLGRHLLLLLLLLQRLDLVVFHADQTSHDGLLGCQYLLQQGH